MRIGKLKHLARGALAASLAISLSVMMTPAAAFAVDYAYIYTANDPDKPLGVEIPGFTADGNAVKLEASNGGTGEVTITGNVNAAGIGIKAKATEGTESNPSQAIVNMDSVSSVNTGVEAIADEYSSSTVIGDDITTTNFGSYAVRINGSNSGKAQVMADDLVAPAGVHLSAKNQGVAGLMAGNVTANGTIDDPSVSVNAFETSDFGEVKAQIEGITSGVNGINASSSGNGWTDVNVFYEVTAGKTGLNLVNDGGVICVAVGSNVSSGQDGINYTGRGTDSETFASIGGNLESTGGSGISYDSGNGSTTVLVKGGVTSKAKDADTAGLSYCGTDKGIDHMLVMEMLSGFNGVLLSDDSSNNPEKLELTVWKIEANGGEVIEGDDSQGTFAKSVHYIVKVLQPAAGAVLTATKADGSPLDRMYDDPSILGTKGLAEKAAAFLEEEGIPVASEGQKVLLKVDAQSGYRVKGAYNGKGEKVELLVDDNGDYYVIVPRGGGIYLSVDMAKTANISFDLGGGTLDGQTGTIVMVCDDGSVITLPGAPTRDGYTFLYWEGSHYDANASYTVAGDHPFKAVWEKNVEPVNPVPAPISQDSGNSASAMPATGDDLPVLPVGVALLLAGVALVATRTTLRSE